MTRNKLIHDINQLATRYTGVTTEFKRLQQLKKHQLDKMYRKLLKAVSLKGQAETMRDVNDNPARAHVLEREASLLWMEAKQI